MNWYKIAQSIENENNTTKTIKYQYLGTCISTVDDSCIWDATEMAQIIDNSKAFDIYDIYQFLNKDLQNKVSKNSSFFECGINNDIIWVYDTQKDIHYFYKKYENQDKNQFLKSIVDIPKTWLSARLRKVAAREALDITENYVQFVLELTLGEQLSKDIKQNIERVKRCKKGSRGKDRTRMVLKQRIDEVVKEVIKTNPDLIVVG